MEKARELLPEYEQIVFKKTFLELCLVQVKYPPIQRFSDEKYMADIKEAITEEYPLVSTEQGLNIVITPQGVNQAPGANQLRFTSIDSNWSVVLSSEVVSLEAREYTHFDELSTRFNKVLGYIAKYFHPRYQLRLGLRYINEFRHSNEDSYDTWRRLLNPELLGLTAGSILDGKVEQTIAESLTRRNDGRILIRHGFLNGTTVTPTTMHSAKTGPFYLLDLDYYDEMAVKFDVEMPVERIKGYNNFLYRIFRWSIGDSDLYQLMKGKK